MEIVNAKKGEHEGHYRCVAKNPAGTISASANLKVNKSECLLYSTFCLRLFDSKQISTAQQLFSKYEIKNIVLANH